MKRIINLILGVEEVRKIRKVRNKINIIIKSTVPIGFTEKMNKNMMIRYFSPEFFAGIRTI